jgi:hypothetical protein
VLNIRAAVLEDAIDRGEEVTIVQLDYDAWFHNLIREIAWANIRGRAVPEDTVQLIEEMYTGIQNCVATTHGRTDLFPRYGTSGVGQGAVISPDISKFAQDPFLRALEERRRVYKTAEGTRVSNVGYSEDHLVMIPTGEEARK